MKPFWHFAVQLVFVLLLSACSGSAFRWTPEYHVVERGDTLYSIAWRYQLDQKQLAEWNQLGDGSLIYVGQKIKLDGPNASGSTRSASRSKSSGSKRSSPPPKKGPAKPVGDWRWPVTGPVRSAFGASPATAAGIHIAGDSGQRVKAASGGTVVYAGNGLKGYGNLLIIKHNSTFLSAYGFNSKLLVGEGDRVKTGQQVAVMGENRPGKYTLHFEIRRDGKPVDPIGYLPRR